MKIETYINSPVEIDISIPQIIENIEYNLHPSRVEDFFQLVIFLHSSISNASDDLINSLTLNQRKTIGDALKKESFRFLRN